MHGRCRMTIDPRLPSMPGWSVSDFHRSGRHCLHQAGGGTGCCGRVSGATGAAPAAGRGRSGGGGDGDADGAIDCVAGVVADGWRLAFWGSWMVLVLLMDGVADGVLVLLMMVFQMVLLLFFFGVCLRVTAVSYIYLSLYITVYDI